MRTAIINYAHHLAPKFYNHESAEDLSDKFAMLAGLEHCEDWQVYIQDRTFHDEVEMAVAFCDFHEID